MALPEQPVTSGPDACQPLPAGLTSSWCKSGGSSVRWHGSTSSPAKSVLMSGQIEQGPRRDIRTTAHFISPHLTLGRVDVGVEEG